MDIWVRTVAILKTILPVYMLMYMCNDMLSLFSWFLNSLRFSASYNILFWVLFLGEVLFDFVRIWLLHIDYRFEELYVNDVPVYSSNAVNLWCIWEGVYCWWLHAIRINIDMWILDKCMLYEIRMVYCDLWVLYWSVFYMNNMILIGRLK